MDRTELGRLIKEARLAKKMTQSEVVGTFITRNMLSQIESGTAIPSIKTLEYLSKKLDISIKMLTPEAQNTDADNNAGSFAPIVKAKDAYHKGEYMTAIDLVKPLLPVSDADAYDEACAIYTLACLACSKSEELSTGVRLNHAKEAMLYAEKGIYASSECKTAAFEQLKTLSKM